jgi:glycosyltransferase involved in cell wall biosynthesis
MDESLGVVTRECTEGPPGFLVLGSMGYPPNATGLVEFCRAAREHLSEGRLHVHVAGKGKVPKELHGVPGITFHGFVPDLAGLAGRCVGALAPLWAGSGMKLKMLDFVALGLPIVATPVSAEGVEQYGGLVVASSPEDLVAGCFRVVQDPEISERAQSSAARLREQLSWARAVETLWQFLQNERAVVR